MKRGGYDNAFSTGKVGIRMSLSEVTLELFFRNRFGIAIGDVVDSAFLLEGE